ncbi:Hypothetical protein FSTVST1_447 [Faustovirus ST1]|nr:Hypothetical protein FSTVST1_447 [Faustovirus ST1]
MGELVIPWELIIEVAECGYEAWLGLRQCSRRLHSTLDMATFMTLFTHRGMNWGEDCTYYYRLLPDGKRYRYVCSNHYNYLSYDLSYYVFNRLVKKCIWIVCPHAENQDVYIKVEENRYDNGMRTTIKIAH